MSPAWYALTQALYAIRHPKEAPEWFALAVFYGLSHLGTRAPLELLRAVFLRMATCDDRCRLHPDCAEHEALGRACHEELVRPWLTPIDDAVSEWSA